jgi:hypothetical protein
MNVTIDLPEQAAAALEAQARAAQMPKETYLVKIVQKALHSESCGEEIEQTTRKPKKSAYGLLAQYGPGPTEYDIDESRREMFRGFGETAP